MKNQPSNLALSVTTKKLSLFALAAAAISLSYFAPQSRGQGVISFNEDAFGTITATAPAGILTATNWNDSFLLNNGQTGNDTFNNLVNSAGTATTLSLTTRALNLFQIRNSDPGADANGTSNKRLLNGYLNAGGTGTPSSSFALSNIPYASYNIIVYFSSDVAGRTGTVSNGTTTYDFSTIGAPSIAGTNALFTQTTSTTGTNPAANYAIFSNLTGANQTLTSTIPAFGGLAGFQVVQVPEPSSLALAVIALGVSVFLYRRRVSPV